MKPIKLVINSKTQKYPVFIGSNLISKLSKILKKNSLSFNKCLLVIDKKVPKKFVNKLKQSLKIKKRYIYFFNASEINKNQKSVNKILEILLSKNFSRKDCLITVGGGITGDVGGFAASLFKRGIQLVNIPTTLLSQVDSSIGGKTGINSKYGKNMVGTFYQPKLVISDIDFLKTLPKREIICGYGEILKHSLIASKNFYKFLDKNYSGILKLKSSLIEKAIYESCKIKKKFIENDEKENGIRKVLNFGHTFAHAYEATLKYSNKLNHGEAVLLGIQTALKFSFKNKLLDKKDYSGIINHLNNPPLPSKITKYFSVKDLNKILFFMTKDKKNNSHKIQLLLLKKIGYPITNKEYKNEKLKSFLKKELTN